MVSVCPNIPDAGRYSVTQSADLLGISRATINRRISEGWIMKAQYRDNNRPYITGKEIKRFFRSVSDRLFV